MELIVHWWSKYKVEIPEARIGHWAVKRFEVTKMDAELFNLSLLFHGSGYCSIVPGVYTKLVHSFDTIMSDTRAEIRDHLEIINKAHGRVLLNGLGLGLVLRACLLKPEVSQVTVIEIAPEVISLVAPYLHEQFGDKFIVHEADALTWKAPKGSRWNVAWHDIWSELCVDNLPIMHKLHRRYGHRCDWQGSWGREILEYESRRVT